MFKTYTNLNIWSEHYPDDAVGFMCPCIIVYLDESFCYLEIMKEYKGLLQGPRGNICENNLEDYYREKVKRG